MILNYHKISGVLLASLGAMLFAVAATNDKIPGDPLGLIVGFSLIILGSIIAGFEE